MSRNSLQGNTIPCHALQGEAMRGVAMALNTKASPHLTTSLHQALGREDLQSQPTTIPAKSRASGAQAMGVNSSPLSSQTPLPDRRLRSASALSPFQDDLVGRNVGAQAVLEDRLKRRGEGGSIVGFLASSGFAPSSSTSILIWCLARGAE